MVAETLRTADLWLDGLTQRLDGFNQTKEERIQEFLKRYAPAWLTPDQLSLIRILIIFPIIYCITSDWFGIALSSFILASLLDLIDGPLARLRHQETDFGKILDPFADKVLIDGTLLCIFLNKPEAISANLFFLTIGADFVLIFFSFAGKPISPILGLRWRLGANRWGKWKFTLQSIGVPLLIFGQAWIAQLFLWIAVALAQVSHLVLWSAVGLALSSIIAHIRTEVKK